MSDRFGRKPIMIICISGSVIGIGLFAITVSLNWDNYLPLWASILPLFLAFFTLLCKSLSKDEDETNVFIV